jgi:SAM-dependent methyltransferase
LLGDRYGMTAIADLKHAHRATWASGNYAAIAEHIDDVPPAHLFARLPITAGQDVLDVAAGTGNATLRAARAGANVIGLDLTPELFETARRRAAAEHLSIDWVEGDCEALPYADESFDAVLSIFGIQFAPRHRVTALELARVCRPGGHIGLVNWTPDGFIGQFFRVMSAYLPAAPDFASPPPLWGDAEHVETLFTGTGVEWEFTTGHNPWRFADAEAMIAFFEANYGPTVKARARLEGEGTWLDCRRELVELAERFDEGTDGEFLVRAEYLVAVGTV